MALGLPLWQPPFWQASFWQCAETLCHFGSVQFCNCHFGWHGFCVCGFARSGLPFWQVVLHNNTLPFWLLRYATCYSVILAACVSFCVGHFVSVA
jgi:hypothetical protein